MICAAGVDLPAVKLRAVRVRHVFGLLHQQQVDEIQMQAAAPTRGKRVGASVPAAEPVPASAKVVAATARKVVATVAAAAAASEEKTLV